MAKKLFIGSLPYSTTSEELEEMFAAHGEVESAVVINDRESGRSKGFGFVEYKSDEDAEAAVKAMDGTDVGGRSIVVSPARPKARD